MKSLDSLRSKLNLSTVIFLSASVLLGAAIARQVFFTPVIGLADNGDYKRIMGSFGIRHNTDIDPDPYFDYFQKTYQIADQYRDNITFLSSEKLFVQAGVWINSLFSPKNLLDIRFIGGLHALVYWIAGALLLYCFQKGRLPVQIILSFFLVLILSDVGYVQYFNSFYSEPSSMIGLLLLSGLTIYIIFYEPAYPVKYIFLIVYMLAAILLILAKPQNSALGIFLAIWIVWFFVSEIPQNRMKWLYSGAAGMVILAGSVYTLNAGVHGDLLIANHYNSIFMGILKVSTDPVGDLQELNIGYAKRFSEMIGMNWWEKKTTDFIQQNPKLVSQFSKFSFQDIVLFYLKHPLHLYQLSRLAILSAYETHIAGLGNFEKSSGIQPGTASNRFNTWSEIKRSILPRVIQFYIFFALANLLALAFVWRLLFQQKKLRLLPEFHLLLIILTGIELLSAIVGEGLADMTKHLLLFNLTWDLCFLFLLFYGVQMLTALFNKRVARYG